MAKTKTTKKKSQDDEAKCGKCGAQTKTQSALARHMKEKHGENVSCYCCLVCNKYSKRKETILKHLKAKHSVDQKAENLKKESISRSLFEKNSLRTPAKSRKPKSREEVDDDAESVTSQASTESVADRTRAKAKEVEQLKEPMTQLRAEVEEAKGLLRKNLHTPTDETRSRLLARIAELTAQREAAERELAEDQDLINNLVVQENLVWVRLLLCIFTCSSPVSWPTS